MAASTDLVPIQYEAFDAETGAVVRIGTLAKCRNTARKLWPMGDPEARTVLCRRMLPMRPTDLGMTWEQAITSGMAQPIEFDHLRHHYIYTL